VKTIKTNDPIEIVPSDNDLGFSAEAFPSVEILRLEPGDVIIASFDGNPSRDSVRAAIVTVQERFPGHEVLGVANGVKISVARDAA